MRPSLENPFLSSGFSQKMKNSRQTFLTSLFRFIDFSSFSSLSFSPCSSSLSVFLDIVKPKLWPNGDASGSIIFIGAFFFWGGFSFLFLRGGTSP